MSGWSFEYDIEVDEANRIVYEKIFGVWRIKTAESYRADFEEEVKPIIDRPWAKLIDLSNWKTSYPEVIDIVGKHLAWCRRHNMQWSVNVINNTITYNQLQRMFDKGATKEISRTFRNYAEAVQFLQEQGYTVRPTPPSRT
ncbi:MAG TPA: hypothetical protein PK186_11080 [candidate division Zixibacteria bacterium]|nr:hypothetical protein [candidate division Zixibacteria bacterium]MDD4917849.1 hypothetical protein [candidate division Zixibacteria bacterium]MDM7973539.1 hypothetical protein [candidate division Zixibacteria bacterium]HOD67772.1 hypothetical protein [candidate division Zixibacteria bacterium]HPC11473.1 hypothetical protein [candidate division Zixibacteria bacterium]